MDWSYEKEERAPGIKKERRKNNDLVNHHVHAQHLRKPEPVLSIPLGQSTETSIVHNVEVKMNPGQGFLVNKVLYNAF